MQFVSVLLALSAAVSNVLAAPHVAQGAMTHDAIDKRDAIPAPAAAAAADPKFKQPARPWTLSGYSTGNCTPDKWDNQSPPLYSNNVASDCTAFDPDNSPTTIIFNGNGAWLLNLFEDAGCDVSDKEYHGSTTIDQNDLRCWDMRGYRAFSVEIPDDNF